MAIMRSSFRMYVYNPSEIDVIDVYCAAHKVLPKALLTLFKDPWSNRTCLSLTHDY